MPPFKPKIYGTTIVNDKGQIVIPAEARAELGLEPGTRLMIMGAPFEGSIVVIKTSVVESQANTWLNEINKPNKETTE